ncbi:MAG: hypothetical protein AAF211_23910, partial [Myxococcota bacterium]
MRMGMGIVALLAVMGSADADAKPPKPGKIRAEAMLGDDGPRLHEFVQWRAVPVVDMPEAEAPAESEAPAEGEAVAPEADDAAPTEEAPAEEAEPEGPPPIDLGGGELDAELPPGRYILEAEIAPFVHREEIEVRAKKRITLDVVFEGAFVEYAPKNAPETFTCGATNGKVTDSFSASEPTKRFFEAGIWEVTCERGVLSTGSVIKLNNSNMVKITPDLATGRIEAAVINSAEYPDKVYWELRDVSPDGPQASKVAVYAETGQTLGIDLPPGTYEVFAKMAYDRPVPDFLSIEGTGRTTIDVGSAESLELDIPWAMVLPVLELGRKARKPTETRWFIRKEGSGQDEAPLAIRLKPEGTPF